MHIFEKKSERRLKNRGSFKFWRKISNWSIGKSNAWYMRGKGCSCNSSRTQAVEVTDKYIGFTGLVLKNWTDGDQTLNDIIRGIFINITCTLENNIF